MLKHPNLFIVGAPKCGTTALSEYLSTHPEIFICSPKEPRFFTEEIRLPTIQTWEQYLNLFKPATAEHKMIGEASVHYLCSPAALMNIYQFNPEAKIIVMLRNPVDQLYSFYYQLRYNGDEPAESFEEAWHSQFSSARQISDPSKPDYLIWPYKAIGQLGSQVEKLLEIFSAEQVKLIVYDDFNASTQTIYEEVLEFLNISLDGKDQFIPVNANRKHRISWLGNLTENPPEILLNLARKSKQILGKESFGIIDGIRQANLQYFKRQPLDPQFRAYLTEQFTEEVQKLSSILKRDLSHWLN